MGARLGRVALAALSVLAAEAAPATAAELRVVQANVGNVNVPGCQQQVYKLCLRPVEVRAVKALRDLRPDLVGFEEILPPDLCRRAPSTNPDNLCSGPLRPPSQVERLLGSGYRHLCDARFGWDCLAVASRRLQLAGFRTRPIQPTCEDSGFTLGVGTVRLRGWPLTAVVAHPSSTDAPCRARQLDDLFSSLPARAPAILIGDWNLDPFREDDPSVGEWRRWVPSRFRLLSGPELTSFPCTSSQIDPTGRTLDGPVSLCTGPLASRTIDHVLARGLTGGCGVQRVDGGGGMDHRAQVCSVTAGAAVTPAVRLRRRKRCKVEARFRPPPEHLEAVRLRIGGRLVVDRRAPFQARRRGRERTRRARVAARPLLSNGSGPLLRRVVRPCARRR
jgi:hypothetical protein